MRPRSGQTGLILRTRSTYSSLTWALPPTVRRVRRRSALIFLLVVRAITGYVVVVLAQLARWQVLNSTPSYPLPSLPAAHQELGPAHGTDATRVHAPTSLLLVADMGTGVWEDDVTSNWHPYGMAAVNTSRSIEEEVLGGLDLSWAMAGVSFPFFRPLECSEAECTTYASHFGVYNT